MSLAGGLGRELPSSSRRGLKGLPFSMPIDLSMIDHRLVPLQPRLALDEAVERLEEAQVVGDGVVEDDVDGVDEGGRRWVAAFESG